MAVAGCAAERSAGHSDALATHAGHTGAVDIKGSREHRNHAMFVARPLDGSSAALTVLSTLPLDRAAIDDLVLHGAEDRDLHEGTGQAPQVVPSLADKPRSRAGVCASTRTTYLRSTATGTSPTWRNVWSTGTRSDQPLPPAGYPAPPERLSDGRAGVAELVDARALKPRATEHVGSSPTARTTRRYGPASACVVSTISVPVWHAYG